MNRRVKFRSIKDEIRILGVDDGGFAPRSAGEVEVIGVVFRGGYWLDGVMRTRVEIDGVDATDKISKMITDSPHYRQIRVIMLNGITFGGFNVVDIKHLFELTNLPVISAVKKKANLEEIRTALENLSGSNERWKAVQNAGEILEVKTREENEPIYIQTAGISKEDAVKIVVRSSTRSSIPEPLRVAHIVASGLATVERHLPVSSAKKFKSGE